MDTRLTSVATLLVLCAFGGGAAAQDIGTAASAPGAANADTSASVCEAEVGKTVQLDRAGATQVQFVGAKRSMVPITDDETAIKGEGRYRNRAGRITPFTYNCLFNLRTGQASGVLFSESGGAAATAIGAPAARGARNAGAVVEPIVTTDACESAVAKALQDKYPRASRIVFGSDTRRLQPAAEARTEMEGEGALQRAPGMSAAKFSYRCVIDPRSGKVERVQTSE